MSPNYLEDKNPTNQSQSATCPTFFQKQFSLRKPATDAPCLRVWCTRLALANGNAPRVPSDQSFNLFKPFIISLLFSHFQQSTPIVLTYLKWLSISHCIWSYNAFEHLTLADSHWPFSFVWRQTDRFLESSGHCLFMYIKYPSNRYLIATF